MSVSFDNMTTFAEEYSFIIFLIIIPALNLQVKLQVR